jgi:two-component system, cell cycle response regulator
MPLCSVPAIRSIEQIANYQSNRQLHRWPPIPSVFRRRLNHTVLERNHEYAEAQLDLAHINHKLQQREAQIVASSLTDPLTGVGNRRRLEQALAAEISRANRTGTRLCAIMADLDHFKRVNDTYGHAAASADGLR